MPLYCLILLFLTSWVTRAANSDIWTQLNRTVNGNLHSAKPFSHPCFSADDGSQALSNPTCSQIQVNYTASLYRAEFYNGFANNQDEICLTNNTDKCLLDPTFPANPSAFTNQTCNQGSVSRYYIDIQYPSHVVAAFEFSRHTGIKLSIKNSGHDYLGRSSLKNSLAVWTRNLRSISSNPSFIPEGCSASMFRPLDTITTAAGVNTGEVYSFADSQNVTFIGPYGTSIGVSGGWVQGGGHTVLSPVYGLGIDRVLQFKIVTPDGVERVANTCQNEDLFWALRGGGGGTFGVVLESTHRVEKVVSLIVAEVRYKQTTNNVNKWFDLLVNNSLPWVKQGWGGHFRSSNLLSVTPLLSLEEAKDSMKAATGFALANNGTFTVETLPSWQAFYTKYLIPNEAAVGTPRILASRLIPSIFFSTQEGRTALFELLQKAIKFGFSPYIPTDTPFLYPYAQNSTSSTIAWRDSVWMLSFGVDIGWNATLIQQTATLAKQASLIKDMEDMIVKFGGVVGSYFNEDSPWTKNWTEKWWGKENYERLHEIKRRYDPEGLLRCWKCVGFEKKDADERFPCYGGVTSLV